MRYYTKSMSEIDLIEFGNGTTLIISTKNQPTERDKTQSLESTDHKDENKQTRNLIIGIAFGIFGGIVLSIAAIVIAWNNW